MAESFKALTTHATANRAVALSPILPNDKSTFVLFHQIKAFTKLPFRGNTTIPNILLYPLISNTNSLGRNLIQLLNN